MDPTVRITWIGAGANLALSLLKIAIGTSSKSISLVADGVHSLSDLLTDAAVLIGIKVASAPADDSHPYGHGRFETFASAFVSFVLMAIGLGVIWRSAASFLGDAHMKAAEPVLIVALVSIAVKEWLFRATRRVAIASHSPATEANAWHHRTDAMSSVAVVVGALLARYGWPHGDQLAGVVVGVMIVAAGGTLLFNALLELGEATVEQRFEESLKSIIEDENEALSWHRIRGRRVGRQIFLDCHIQVDPGTSVLRSHALTQRIEKRLHDEIATPVNLLIHIEPYQ